MFFWHFYKNLKKKFFIGKEAKNGPKMAKVVAERPIFRVPKNIGKDAFFAPGRSHIYTFYIFVFVATNSRYSTLSGPFGRSGPLGPRIHEEAP